MVGLSAGEKQFIQGAIAEDLRCDGRKRLAYRRIDVETGVIPQVVNYLIEVDPSRSLVNAQDKKKQFAPIHTASCLGNHDMVELLCVNGADVNLKDHKMYTPWVEPAGPLRSSAGMSSTSVYKFLPLSFDARKGWSLCACVRALPGKGRAFRVLMPWKSFHSLSYNPPSPSLPRDSSSSSIFSLTAAVKMVREETWEAFIGETG